MKFKYLLLVGAVALLTVSASAQTVPSEARIRADVMNPGVIAIIMRGQGSVTRFRENGAIVDEYYRSITVRRKTDKPGVTVDVIGDAVYRLIGGRWVFRRMRLAGNTYAGIDNPTIDELNRLVAVLQPSDVDNMWSDMIGEIESVRLWSYPNWEFHSPNSVSFNVVVVHSYIHRGGHYTRSDVPQEQIAPPMKAVDRVERIMRWRIYRDSEKLPWARMTWTKAGRIGDYIRDEAGQQIEMIRLLGRRAVHESKLDALSRPGRVPMFTK